MTVLNLAHHQVQFEIEIHREIRALKAPPQNVQNVQNDGMLTDYSRNRCIRGPSCRLKADKMLQTTWVQSNLHNQARRIYLEKRSSI